mmetsp:Transcript_15436/g.18564  ORF Transcript_15436/g.18564 Transcript_15436/m.18564 type:complete len:327 (+) Transcript_15436:50-1030(+)|eukprot:jgi/Bigna1/56244/estExt_Genewise1Plus.C_890019
MSEGKDQGSEKPRPSSWVFISEQDISAITAKTISAPFEYVKIVTQLRNESIRLGAIPSHGATTWSILAATWNAGPFGFFSGNGFNIIRYFPTLALNSRLKVWVYSMFFDPSSKPKDLWSKLSRALSGGLVAGLVMSITYPLDSLRTICAFQTAAMAVNPSYKPIVSQNPFLAIWDVLSSPGTSRLQMLYSGFGATLCGIFVYRCTYFALYDTFKHRLLGKSSSFWSKFAFGYGITALSGTITYPFDTIRRRMMVANITNAEYISSSHCVNQVFQEDNGMGAFFAGTLANIMRGFVATAVLTWFEERQKSKAKRRKSTGKKRNEGAG